MTVVPLSHFYVDPPDVPAGMTLAQYRRSRPQAVRWSRRALRACWLGRVCRV